MEITLTKPESDIQIIFREDYFLLEFHSSESQIRRQLEEMDGAVYGLIEDYKWVVPKTHLKELNRLFFAQIKWKTPDEMESQKKDLLTKEETLDDVLSRMPKNISTPYMKIEPYDFQKVAVAWAVTPKGKRGNIYGGLLADLMGLGKTIQALAISGYLKNEGKLKKTLIICPATLKMQWQQEVEKFTHEKAVIIEGDKKKRSKQFKEVREENPFYTIINYELLYQKDILERVPVGKPKKGQKQKTKVVYGDYNVLNQILNIDYDMVIIDEAHRMKNPDTETAKAIREIQPNYRLLMTGTPIEKDLENIFQLMDYLSPNIFANEDMAFEDRRKLFEDRFLIVGWNPFTKWEKERMVVGSKNIGLLKNLISPYMLRRTTEEVSDDMPDMIGDGDTVVVDWDKDQKSLHDQLKEELLALQQRKAEAKKITDKEKAQKFLEGISNEMNANLMYMLEVCDTPELLLMSDSPLAQRKLGKRNKFAKPPKLKRLVEMCEEIMTNSDEKIVIFSKFERMTQILKRELDELSEQMARSNGKPKNSREFGITMYTGTTPKGCKWRSQKEKEGITPESLDCTVCPFLESCKTRTKSAYFFQNEPSTRIIIATDAANYGVNLQAGRYLINYDLPDSYSIYSQRNGRIRRLGSKHDQVYIYNLVINGGIDAAKFTKLMKQKDIIDPVVEKTVFEEDAVLRATASMNMELLKEIQKEAINS